MGQFNFRSLLVSREQLSIELNERAHLLENTSDIPTIRLIDRKTGQPQIVTRKIPHKHQLLDPYHNLIDIKWWKLFLILTVFYLSLHLFFAFLYWFGGEEGLTGQTKVVSFMDYFWFSVQTMTTIGYGHMSPNSTYINIVVFIESWISFFLEACMISLAYGKFSRPSRLKRNIHFSKFAVVHEHAPSAHTKKKKPSSPTKSPSNKNQLKKDEHVSIQEESLQTEEDFADQYIHTDSDDSLLDHVADEIDVDSSESTTTTNLLENTRNINKVFLRHNTLKDIPTIQKKKMLRTHHFKPDANLFITFRCINLRFKTQFVDTKLQLLCLVHSPNEKDPNKLIQVYELDYYVHEQMEHAHALEFSNPVLPIPWCITHQITAKSPLYQFLAEGASPLVKGSTFEIIPVLDGVDGATSDNYQARYSYCPQDVLMDCRFQPCLSFHHKSKKFIIDFSKFDAINFHHEDEIVPFLNV